MTIAAQRLGLDPAELAPPQPDPGRRVPLPHAVGRALRLRRLRGLPRRRARARALRRAARRARPRRAPRAACSGSASPASSSRRSRTWATSRSRRRPSERGGALPEVGQRRGRDDRDRPARRHHRADRRRRRRARVTAPSARRSSPTRSACDARATSTCSRSIDTATIAVDGRLRATTRRASPASRVGAVAGGCAERLRATKLGAIRDASAGDDAERVAAPASPASRTGTPRRSRAAWSPACADGRFLAAPNLDPPDADDRVASSGRPRLHRRRRASSRSTARPARCACSTT